MASTTLSEALRRNPAIAIIRSRSSDRAAAVVETLAANGITAVEVTLTTPGAEAAIAAVPPGLLAVGAGTVLDAAGAAFLITPAVLPGVLDEARRLGVPVACGAMTPTEILTAHLGGASLVKVFPADTAGGPAYIRAVLAPLPDIPLVPTGGVLIAQAADYLRAGARAVALGSPLIGDAADGGDLAALARRAPASRLTRAAGCGAVAASTMGDWEGPGSRADLAALSSGDIRR